MTREEIEREGYMYGVCESCAYNTNAMSPEWFEGKCTNMCSCLKFSAYEEATTSKSVRYV